LLSSSSESNLTCEKRSRDWLLVPRPIKLLSEQASWTKGKQTRLCYSSLGSIITTIIFFKKNVKPLQLPKYHTGTSPSARPVRNAAQTKHQAAHRHAQRHHLDSGVCSALVEIALDSGERQGGSRLRLRPPTRPVRRLGSASAMAAGSRKEEERNERVVRGLLKLPPNRRCVNCNGIVSRFPHLAFCAENRWCSILNSRLSSSMIQGPQYVCTSFWNFVCVSCSGIQ
jgi:hypothetical protein